MVDSDFAHYHAATPGVATMRLGLGLLAGGWLVLQPAQALPSWVLAMTGGLGVLALWQGRWVLAGVAAGVALGGGSLALALADRLDPVLDGTVISFVGVVEDLPRAEPRRQVLTLRVETGSGLPRRVRISWYEPDAVPRPGERWQFSAKLQRPRGVVNSGSASREGWLLRQRIGATGYASGAAAGERLDSCADRLLCLRGYSAGRVVAAVPDERAAAVLIAIALGFRGGLDAATREALAATGTGHLLAISGLHVGLAAAAGGLVGGLAGRWFGTRLRPARDWAAIGALSTAAAYCLLAGMPVSARRALLMTAVALAALVMRRGRSVALAIGAALALVLVADPLAVLDPGLWLSFGAVATILAAVSGRLESQAWGPAVVRIQAALAIGMLACTVAWFGRVSLVAPLANLAAVPWFSVAVVPPALAGVVLSWLSPDLGAWALRMAGLATTLALGAIGHIADWPLATRPVAAPSALAILLAVCATAWCLLPRPAPGRVLAPLLFLPMLLGASAAPSHGGFELRVFDVGHGLAVLVRTRNHAMMYDAGPAWPGGDAAEWSVVPALRALGLRQIDTLVISHGHADHAGGAATVRAAYPGVAEWAGHGAEQPGNQPCRPGLEWSWDGVRLSVLHPEHGFRGGKNDGSCVVLVEGAGGRVLLTGDIEARGERSLLRMRARLPVDLVVAPHHGSRTSSGAALVEATRPAWAVFSTNWRNRWGFPADNVVDRWRRAGAVPLSTDRQGEIVIRFEPHGPGPVRLARHVQCRPWLDCT